MTQANPRSCGVSASVSMAAAILISVPVTFAAATMPAMAQGASDIAIGKQIAPVPITIPSHVPPASVYLGSYIVNAVAACNNCHSNNPWAPNGNPFMGFTKLTNTSCYLNGGRSFQGGLFHSRNITPDASGKPNGITLAQFVQVMRTGADLKNPVPGHLLQSMPWPAFQDMADNDLNAIYDYLSSIPSLPLGGTSPC